MCETPTSIFPCDTNKLQALVWLLGSVQLRRDETPARQPRPRKERHLGKDAGAGRRAGRAPVDEHGVVDGAVRLLDVAGPDARLRGGGRGGVSDNSSKNNNSRSDSNHHNKSDNHRHHHINNSNTTTTTTTTITPPSPPPRCRR